jgi:hypothetical protein
MPMNGCRNAVFGGERANLPERLRRGGASAEHFVARAIALSRVAIGAGKTSSEGDTPMRERRRSVMLESFPPASLFLKSGGCHGHHAEDSKVD